MERRQYLVVAATALSSVAGCSQSNETNEQESTETTTPPTTEQPETTTPQTTAETPKEAARSYLTAVFSGNVQAANALIHPDGNVNEYTEDAAARNEEIELTIESIETTNESETTATVSVVASLNNPEADGTVERSQVFTLRTDGGTWKLYDSEDDEAA